VFFSGQLGWLPADGTRARGPMPRYLTHDLGSQKSSSNCLACTPASLKSIATDKTSDLCCHRTSHHVVTYSQCCLAQCPATTSSASSIHQKLQWSKPRTTKDLFSDTATTSKASQADTQRLPTRHHILRPRLLRPCLPSCQSGIARHADWL
jgi:hypothetical protein